jgi:2-polyprenyl-6-methoxyphenol hydroxylase-like FAD-dependent oxidoreductase
MVAMTDATHETDVLIVGGGPVGTALALDLKYRNVNFMIIDASDGSVSHPKVSTVGPRSMEFFRRWGAADKIRNAGWPGDYPLDVAWVTKVGGHEVYRLNRGTADSRPLHTHTPESDQICPAHWLTPLLMREVGIHPDGPLRMRCKLEGFVDHDDHVVATITNLADGSVLTVQARFMVACDGASSPVRRACDIASPVQYETRVFRNILFRAPHLREQLGPRNALVYFPMLSSSVRFPMRAIDGRALYNIVVGVDGSEQSTQPAMSLVTSAIAFDTPLEVLFDSEWHLTHRVAEQFRVGRVFLVGDAAHTLSPSGGFGMNTGICGAADLGWKLAAELDGWAGPGLLDTYQAERRPIAVESLEEANVNLLRTMKRALPPDLHLDSPEGERARAEMAQRLEGSDVRREFDAPMMHFGFRYTSSIIVPDPVAVAPASPDWRPNAVPGSRAPHSWLRAGVSTLDLFGRGFSLLCFAESDQREGVEHAFADRRVPIETTVCGDARTAELYEYPFVLVRPDGHVAWRGNDLPSDASWLVDKVRGAG